jgi:hypothetical protein
VPDAELVQQPVERLGLGVDTGVAGVSCAEQVTVVVPLDVGDVVLGQQRVQSAEDVVVGVRVAQVEDLLVAEGRGKPVLGWCEHPVGVGPV